MFAHTVQNRGDEAFEKPDQQSIHRLLFNEPSVYKAIREHIMPHLKNYPFVKIWYAGCATGEEVYSMAILLKEEGLYDRTQIYATDGDNIVLRCAEQGIYDKGKMPLYSRNYRHAGGKNALSDYFLSKNGSIMVTNELKENIDFIPYNLYSDHIFGEMHLIMIKDTLEQLSCIRRNRVLQLLSNSLIDDGFLCFNKDEAFGYELIINEFERFLDGEEIYQKRIDDSMCVAHAD